MTRLVPREVHTAERHPCFTPSRCCLRTSQTRVRGQHQVTPANPGARHHKPTGAIGGCHKWGGCSQAACEPPRPRDAGLPPSLQPSENRRIALLAPASGGRVCGARGMREYQEVQFSLLAGDFVKKVSSHLSGVSYCLSFQRTSTATRMHVPMLQHTQQRT
jgi:hypothetical protein